MLTTWQPRVWSRKNAVLPEAQPDLDTQLVNLREAEQYRTGDSRGWVPASLENDIENVLLDAFSPLPHALNILTQAAVEGQANRKRGSRR